MEHKIKWNSKTN